MSNRSARIAVAGLPSPESGGVYQYTRSVINAIEETDYEVMYFFTNDVWKTTEFYDDDRWSKLSLPFRAIRLLLRKIFVCRSFDPANLGNFRRFLAPKLHLFDPDLVLYPTTNSMSFETGFPYAVAVHDLQHRLRPEFPEVSANGEWQRRDYVFKHACEHAEGILSDSKTGKEDIVTQYDVNPGKVHPIPFVSPDYLSEEENELDQEFLDSLPDNYVFYPAQYWRHKNHVRLLKAVAKVRDHHDISLVLVGSEKNAGGEIDSTISEYGLQDAVYQLGYVPENHMYTLYKGAIALVMPTFFGPTNIPVLEAFQLECPVITSDIHGIPEQVGDAGLLVNPESVDEISEAIVRLYEEPQLRNELVDLGRERASSYTQEDFTSRLNDAVQTAISRQ